LVGLCVLALVAGACAPHRAAAAWSARQPSALITGRTLESWDRPLADALARLAVNPSAEQHTLVATEYHRAGVLDMAFRYFTLATRLDPTDPAPFDGLARVWRDWGVARNGVREASTAVRLAPESAAAANTMGTLFQALGRTNIARQWYAHALTLDADARYALNNFCYASIMLRDANAVAACKKANAAAPASEVARNNLGIAYAAAGEFELARGAMASAGREGSAHYNMGVLYLARERYREAAVEFAAARRADPLLTRALAREQQARHKSEMQPRQAEGSDDHR
jgi:Flp pilus assembly protein TadD